MKTMYSLQNVVNRDELEYLENYFNTRDDYDITNGMKKYPINYVSHDQKFLDLVKDIIENKVGITGPYELLGDNFYQHTSSYYPHCDARQKNSWLNIVVPIKLFGLRQTQKFIVFDQQYLLGNSTWMGIKSVPNDFKSNTSIKVRMCDSEGVINTTNQDINDELYKDIAPLHFPKEQLFGMSGKSFDWIPGNIIVFDSKYIHATGKMNCQQKLGLSIRIGHVE